MKKKTKKRNPGAARRGQRRENRFKKKGGERPIEVDGSAGRVGTISQKERFPSRGKLT